MRTHANFTRVNEIARSTFMFTHGLLSIVSFSFTQENVTCSYGKIQDSGNQPAPISKVERHIVVKFCATLWCGVNRYSDRSGSE